MAANAKLVIRVRNANREWDEEYDPGRLVDPARMYARVKGYVSVSTQDEADKWALALVEAFNEGQPKGQERTLVRTTLQTENGGSDGSAS